MFLGKESILSGRAEEQACKYLQLTNKQKAVQDCLAQAKRLVQSPPYPSLPEAIAKLVEQKGIVFSESEAAEFLEQMPEPATPVLTPEEPVSESIEISLSKENVEAKHLTIPPKYHYLFPPKTPSKKHEPKTFTVYDADGKEYKTHIEGNNRLPGIRGFFHKNPQLKKGDKIYIDIIAPKERYRLRTK